MRLSIVDGGCRPLGGGRYTEHEAPIRTGLSIMLLRLHMLSFPLDLHMNTDTPDVLDRPEFRELLRAARVAQVT